MKKLYRYWIVGTFIVRTAAWKTNRDIEARYMETCKELYDRAEKYGYQQVALD